MQPGQKHIHDWFTSRAWQPFDFQQQTQQAYLDGKSGLLHAPTGMGKTLAVWTGPLAEWINEHPDPSTWNRDKPEPLRVLWLTPLRALASDTIDALMQPIDELAIPWTVEKRTGDTASSAKVRQRTRAATALVTTPESLTLLLSYPDAHTQLRSLRCVIVDEWHELLSTKRGVQTELALARLRKWNPDLRVWGLSATLGNLAEARDALLGSNTRADRSALIAGVHDKEIVVDTILPPDLEHFPWYGHLGIRLLDDVIRAIESAKTSLLFTNTRSQTEIWFNRIIRARPEWIGTVGIHHGSLDRKIRAKVEAGLDAGTLRAVVCTSSLDLGVDFAPVDQVLQIGSPKGIARLTQRAGRSGHRPGTPSRVLCVPAHAFELVEFAAARDGIADRDVEPRRPLQKPLDVLVQHLVTMALAGGFTTDDMLAEIRTTSAYHDLTSTEFGWALDFVTRGGPALNAYPQYKRVIRDDNTKRYTVTDRAITRIHRMSIGTISADTAMVVKFGNGRSLGTIEESFIARLTPGNRFVFAGRILELVRVREMTAVVKVARSTRGVVPRWGGGKSPLSTKLAHRVRDKLNETPTASDAPELRAVAPLLNIQRRWSAIPAPGELLIESTTTEDGHHLFLFPFEGRLVHEGLGALLAHRIAAITPRSLSVTANDYGIELRTPKPIDIDEPTWRTLLAPNALLEDLLRCLNANELARRRFRDIARVAGLIFQGYPGTRKPSRHLQASSELFFDVFLEFDPANLLIDQARREVLSEQLEVKRLRTALESFRETRLVLRHTECPTPLAFPLYAETLRTQHVSTEKWTDRIARMAASLQARSRQTEPAAPATGPKNTRGNR